MTVALYLVAILGLAVLMIVHEAGHYFAARKFGMRVVRFSIGFGPTIWRHKPKGSSTVYQVALIPFLAYVQIAGMNPYEETDPNDRSSYANASLWSRVVTIAAGPLTNYFFASVLIFFGLLIGGKEVADEASMKVVVEPGPAQIAGVETGDRIVEVNGSAVHDWTELRKAVSSHPGDAIDLTLDRDGRLVHKSVTPAPKGEKNEGLILVRPPTHPEPVGIGEAARISVMAPPVLVYGNVRAIGRVLTGKEKLQVSGPVGIVKETAKQAKTGPGILLQFLGMLSAYLGAFNLLPFPALDGGRLLFLGAEAVSRRKPDAKLEARVHAVGLLMLLTLIAFVTYADVIAK
ncbi:MAG TPA: M50 family metallopeptidase [Polyangiaceae bacterium]|nr:M50 family metallopeptidase [Polyangiaceae bacterium]